MAFQQARSTLGARPGPGQLRRVRGDLLVGNFSFKASEINAFDPMSGMFEGTIPIDPGVGNSAGGLWGLIFGNGGSGGDPNTLFFADGINGEADGLFAALTPAPVPEPASLGLLGAALAFVAALRRSALYGVTLRSCAAVFCR